MIGRNHPLPLARLGIRYPHRPILLRSQTISCARLSGQEAYPVNVEPGASVAKGPYVAETLAVSVESNYVVVDL
jgi:hypothetical protein